MQFVDVPRERRMEGAIAAISCQQGACVALPAMRILHVIPSVSPVHGGPSKAIAQMESALAEAGVSVTTATTDDDGPGRRFLPGAAPLAGVIGCRVVVPKVFDAYKFAPALVPWLWRNIRGFDVVHIHALFSFTSTIAAAIAHARGVPYVIRPLGTLGTYGIGQRRAGLKRWSLRLIEGPLLRRAAAVHFTSEAEQSEAAGLGVHLSGVVIPLGIEREPATPGVAPRALADVPNASPVVLYLSRLDPKKNVEVLLRAFAAEPMRQCDAVLLVAGTGEPAYVAGLKVFAASLGLGARVTWAGHLEGSAKSAAFARADVFVLPSLSENFGIAAVEAMLAGLPCVLSAGIAIAGPVAAADACVAIAPEPDDIARALIGLLDDPGRRRALGDRARAYAEREFSSAVMAGRLVTLYRRISSKGATAPQ